MSATHWLQLPGFREAVEQVVPGCDPQGAGLLGCVRRGDLRCGQPARGDGEADATARGRVRSGKEVRAAAALRRRPSEAAEGLGGIRQHDAVAHRRARQASNEEVRPRRRRGSRSSTRAGSCRGAGSGSEASRGLAGPGAGSNLRRALGRLPCDAETRQVVVSPSIRKTTRGSCRIPVNLQQGRRAEGRTQARWAASNDAGPWCRSPRRTRHKTSGRFFTNRPLAGRLADLLSGHRVRAPVR